MPKDTSASIYWDFESAGLIRAGSRAAELLASLRIGPPDNAALPHRQEPHDPTMRITVPPTYIPYVSGRMGRSQDGERICRQAIAVALSPELQESLGRSPVADTTRKMIRLLREKLWDTDAAPAGQVLAQLGNSTPRKGNEVLHLVHEYQRRGSTHPESWPAMAMRDFWGFFQTLMSIRCLDGRMPDLAASVMTFSMGIDYPRFADDSGAGEVEVYIEASGEGMACLTGPAAQQLLWNTTVMTAVIAMKNRLMSQPAEASHEALEEFGIPTPCDYLLARWWDGAQPIIRGTVGWGPYRHLINHRGDFMASDRCGTILRALSALLRYNDVVDLLQDFTSREPFNELHPPLALKGAPGLSGFADGLAAVIDECIECDCGEAGHHEAAEIAMAMCVAFVVGPRYRLRAQLAALTHATPDIRCHFRTASPRQAAMATAATRMLPGASAYAEDWTPLWRIDHSVDDERWLDTLARRAVRRYFLTDETGHPVGVRCATLTRNIVAQATADPDNDTASLHAVAASWDQIFRTAITHPDLQSINDTFDTGLVKELGELTDRFFSHFIAGSTEDPSSLTTKDDVCLFMDTDHAFRRTFDKESEAAVALRRLFLGILTTAVELTGHNPYALLVDGTVRACEAGATKTLSSLM